jgi:hypothetical protein
MAIIAEFQFCHQTVFYNVTIVRILLPAGALGHGAGALGHRARARGGGDR